MPTGQSSHAAPLQRGRSWEKQTQEALLRTMASTYRDGCLQKKTLSVSGVLVLPALLPAHTARGIHHLSLFSRIACWNHQARSCVGGSGLGTT